MDLIVAYKKENPFSFRKRALYLLLPAVAVATIPIKATLVAATTT
jgi:hypothetical protein